MQWSWNQSNGILTVTKGVFARQPVGYGNVSGRFVRELPLDTNDFDALFNANATFGSPLYAPVLVNHHIGADQP